MKNTLINDYFNSKKKIYKILILLNIVIVLSFFILNYFTDRFSKHNKHMTYTIVSMKCLSIQSHLSFMEFLTGDEKEFPKIDMFLNRSFENLNILLNGGVINGFEFNTTHNDEFITNKLKKSKKILLELKSIQNNRVRDNINIRELDDIFDEKFDLFSKTLEELEEYINFKFKNMYSTYTTVKYIIFTSILLIMVLGFYLIRKFNKEIEEKTFLSYIDSLTQIQNRKGYTIDVAKQLQIFQRYKTPFIMIMFDIDNFKEINDTYGHRIGDLVLIDISKMINSIIRNKIDTIYRVGGEEFIIICSNISLKDGKEVSEKIRYNVENDLKTIKDKKITISLGVTEIKDDDTEDSIFKRVDKLMYQSKNSGKNRVTSD
ncbi:GGDEF domain-containing protein [Sulfurimonas sp.]